MSRQEQNVLLGALAFVTAVVLGLAGLRIVTNDGGEIEAGDPAAGSETAAEGGVATLPGATDDLAGDQNALQPLAQGDPSLSSTTSMLDLTSSSVVATQPASPSVSSSTTEGLAPVTTATTVATTASTTATTAATTASTAAPSSSESTAQPGSGSSSTTVAESTTSSTAAGASTSSSSSTTVPDSTTSSSSSSTTTTAAATAKELNALELEIFRLTNQLRLDPNGPLARQGAVPDCGGSLRVDRSTGIYEPLGSLTLDEVASLQVARPWSAQLTRNLQHQPQAGSGALQAAGLNVAFVGENVSFNNYPDKALQHFVGWRESDGHFCNMMNPRFTHIGVGEVTKPNGDSFATQNLFTLR